MNTPDFKTSDERNDWIVAHAECFSCVRFFGHVKYKKERRLTLPEIEALAERMANAEGGRWMIYAVHGPHNVYIKTVSKE